MPVVPVAIPTRPYAICPPTNLMNPDGFFIVNMGPQQVEFALVNQGGALTNVRVYLESLSDPGIALTPTVRSLGTVPGGATVNVRFDASFLGASPGKPQVSIIVEADGHTFRRVIKSIFVTRIDYHKPSKTYGIVMPEGTMRIRVHSAFMGPKDDRCRDKAPFITLLKDITYEWIPVTPYAGTHGPLPYGDPWWKIALAILAVLLVAAGLLYDYFSDGELDGGTVSVGGTFDEVDGSVSCCDKVDAAPAASDSGDWILRGLYGAAGFVGTLAIGSDDPDLHWRGQEATPPAAGVLTTAEAVHLKITYPVAPSLGTPYPIVGDWEYKRTTTAGVLTYGAHDNRKNEHYLSAYEVDAPAVHDRSKGPLRVCARFRAPDGQYRKGNELYVTAVLVSTYGAVRRFQLCDDGRGADKQAGDGWFCGNYQFRRDHDDHGRPEDIDRPGTWYLFVIAQDVNTVPEGTDPFKAAHTIGGAVLTTQLVLNFDQPCQLNHDAVIQVV